MSEPHSSAVSGLIQGAGLSSATLLLGAQPDALAVGLTCAVLSSIWLGANIDTKKKAVAAMALSALLAAYGAPVAAGWAAAGMSGIEVSRSLVLLMAGVIGSCAPTVIPLIVKTAEAVVRFIGNKSGGKL